MEYLSDIREFKLLRNYINNDPVCDYFQLQTHLNNNMNYARKNQRRVFLSKCNT